MKTEHSQFAFCIGVGLSLPLFLGAADRASDPTPAAEPAKSSEQTLSQPEGSLTVDQLLDNMEAVRKKLKTSRAKVVKQRQIEVLELTEKSTGNMWFKMPRLLRLELTDADTGKETIEIVSRTYAWRYRPHKKTAERVTLGQAKQLDKSAYPFEYGLARDIHTLREAYDLKLLPAEKIDGRDVLPLRLDPKGGTDYTTSRFEFWIDKKTWLPLQVREFSSNEEIIETYTLSNVELNVPLADTLFEFEPPDDVEVFIQDVE